MKRGNLLAFEGVDGAGKTTQVRLLERELAGRGCGVLVTKEPTAGEFGARIRASSTAGRQVSAEQELEWFTRDRCEHVQEVIEPALARGEIVLCDRYYLSTIAYQGARGIPYETILSDSEAKFPHPDLALWLDVDPTLGLQRVETRGERLDPIFERQERLEAAARIFARIDRPYVRRIDGSKEASWVAAEIWRLVCERLERLR